MLKVAASVEHLSEHPLGEAIVKAAQEKKLTLLPATGFKALTASGVEATVEGKTISVLKPSAARERGVSFDEAAEAWRAAAQDRGQSVVGVLGDGALIGIIAIADTVRNEAPALVASLRRAGVRNVVMLTGDNVGTAKAIASQIGIEEYYAGLLPEDRVRKVEELVSKYGKVAMVGDGINDAPTLARATVGIAMGPGAPMRLWRQRMSRSSAMTCQNSSMPFGLAAAANRSSCRTSPHPSRSWPHWSSAPSRRTSACSGRWWGMKGARYSSS